VSKGWPQGLWFAPLEPQDLCANVCE
jgi:hypothetical protein